MPYHSEAKDEGLLAGIKCCINQLSRNGCLQRHYQDDWGHSSASLSHDQ